MNKKILILMVIVGLLLLVVTAGGVWAYFEYFSDNGSCMYAGQEYSSGSSFKDSDDCNTCFCENGEVGCTEMACLDEFDQSPIDDNDTSVIDELTYEEAACIGFSSNTLNSMGITIYTDPNWNVNIDASGINYYYISLQGDISVLGWPNIGVTRGLEISAADIVQLETYLQNTFAPDSLTPITFGVGNYDGLLMRTDGCSSDDTSCNAQTWDTEEIYFLHNGLVWNISMTDVDATGAYEVYECFVDNFELL